MSSFFQKSGSTSTVENTIQTDVDAAAASAASAASSATSAASSASSAATAAASVESVAADAAAASSNASAALTYKNAAETAKTAAQTAQAAAETAESNASSSASLASTKAAEASASADDAASSETNAASSATSSASSATASAASASSASASASNASTSEANAASSASSASASSSSASTSAATATTQAGIATTKAGEASASASNASTSESNAASSAAAAAASQSAAAASAASAASAFDSFDDRYLGSKTSDPSLDNDSNPLVSGSLYFNDTEGEMRVYDGSAWISASAATETSLLTYEYTATAAQTTFSGADANGNTLSYTVDNIIVTLNGVVLDPSDYTATNGTSIVLGSGAALNDELNVVAFKSFTTADMVSATNGGTFGNSITINGDLTVDTNTLYVDSTNNKVGIRTSSPTQELEVAGTIRSSLSAANYSFGATTSGGGGFFIEPDDYTLANPTWEIRTFVNEPLAFQIGGTERLRIDSSGNVGIGTASPSTPLDVVSNSGANAIRIRGRAGGDDYGFLTFHSNDGTTRWAEIAGTSGGSLYFTTGTSGAERMRIDSSGNLLVGTTSAWSSTVHLQVKGGASAAVASFEQAGSSGDNIYIRNSNGVVGSITTSGSSTAYNTSSDYRLKENLTEVTGAADRVKALNPVRFNFISDPDKTVDGFLAHEVQDIVPEAISGTKDAMRDEEYEVTPAVLDEDGNVVTEAVMGTRSVPDYQGIDQSKLVPLLTAALQEALTKIDDLETRLAALETV